MRSACEHLGMYGTRLKLSTAMGRLGIDKPRGRLHNAETDAAAALLIDEKIWGSGDRLL